MTMDTDLLDGNPFGNLSEDSLIPVDIATNFMSPNKISPRELEALARAGKLQCEIVEGRRHTTLNEIRLALERTRTGQRVYIVGFAQYVKIGYTASIVAPRVATLEQGLPERLVVYAEFIGRGRDCEAALLARFTPYQTRGEWFRLEGLLQQWIKAGCPYP